MNIKKTLLIIISRFIREIGKGLGTLGTALTAWFLFFSESENKYLWDLLSIIIFFVGYCIYKFAHTHIYDEWDE